MAKKSKRAQNKKNRADGSRDREIQRKKDEKNQKRRIARAAKKHGFKDQYDTFIAGAPAAEILNADKFEQADNIKEALKDIPYVNNRKETFPSNLKGVQLSSGEVVWGEPPLTEEVKVPAPSEPVDLIPNLPWRMKFNVKKALWLKWWKNTVVYKYFTDGF